MNEPYNKGSNEYQCVIVPFHIFLRALVKKWRGITAIVVSITLLTALLFLFALPRSFEAEGYLQVIPISTTLDSKNEFETSILSHLLKMQSAYTANEVSMFLKQKHNIEIDPVKLQKMVAINRPPKSNLIRIVAKTSMSQDVAKLIVSVWIDRYLAIAQKNNINTVLFNIRNSIKQTQTIVNNQQGKVNELRNQSTKLSPLITVTKSIDETQLWRLLVDKPDKEKLKSVEELKIKGEEESKEYITLKTMLYEAEQQLASAKNNLMILQEAEKILQMQADNISNPLTTTSFSSNAVEMAETLIKTSDIIPIGEPALLKSKRGALMYTMFAFIGSILVSFLVVYLREFYKFSNAYVEKNV